MNTLQDRIRGSLIGGAIGDALGYPVEFIYSFEEIQARYGERGITRLDTKQHWLGEEEQTSTAVVSDDTQMTLYTANGLLNAKAQNIPLNDGICRAYITSERSTDQKPQFEVLMWQGTHFTAKFDQASFPKGYLNVWLEYSHVREEIIRRQTEGFVSGFRLIAIRHEEFGKPGTNIIYQLDPEDHTLIPKIDIKEGESVFGIGDFDFNCVMKVGFRPSLDTIDGLIPLYEWEI